jgi:hypothetical protein
MPERRIVKLDDIERRLVKVHRKPFHDWIRQIVTLSSGGLTLLVGLRGNYVPHDPKALWTLYVCWISLATCILSGVVCLAYEWRIPLLAAKHVRDMRIEQGEAATIQHVQTHVGPPVPGIAKWSSILTFCSFCVAVIALTAFALLN